MRTFTEEELVQRMLQSQQRAMDRAGVIAKQIQAELFQKYEHKIRQANMAPPKETGQCRKNENQCSV